MQVRTMTRFVGYVKGIVLCTREEFSSRRRLGCVPLTTIGSKGLVTYNGVFFASDDKD